MTDVQASGVLAGAQYAFEDPDVWGESAASMTASDETYVAFGQGVDVNITRNNNKERVFGIGARNATETVPKQYASALTINGSLTNVYWLLGALGANSDGGSGPDSYTHTYTESTPLPSMTIQVPVSFGDTDYWEEFQGCRVKTTKISAAVNETVKFSLELDVRHDSLNTATKAIVEDAFVPFTFAEGVLELPDGSTIAVVQNIELNFNNNNEPVYGIGSRFMSGNAPKQVEYDFTMSVAIKNFDLLSLLYDGSTGSAPSATDQGTVATLILTFTKGTESIVITMANVHLDSESRPISATEVIKQDMTGWADDLTSVVYTNSVETAPTEADNVV